MRIPDVIVLLPGILGSALQRNGHDVWNLSGGATLRALLSAGGDIHDLALQQDPPDQDDLGDGITATRLLQDVHLIPFLWKIDGYSAIAQTLQDEFELQPGQNYFEFPYDWRRDNRVAARRLARQSRQWLDDWIARSGNRDAKLILIGHSMGGLVARHFLEVLEGWRTTKALITFGTPYRGSLNAVDALANGIRKGPCGILNLSELVRSLTSVYQLLPIYKCYDTGQGGLARVGQTAGIPNLDAGKAAAALAFHDEIRQAVEAHRQQEEYREHGYKIFPVIGIQQATFQSARRSGNGVELLTTYDGKDYLGDGTVPYVSARPIELDDRPDVGMFAATAHASLQNAEAVLAHLKGVLTGLYLDPTQFRAAQPPASPVQVGIDVDDVYWADEPITMDVVVRGQAAELVVVISDIEGDVPMRRSRLQAEPDQPQRVELRPLPPGAYRITVAGDARVEPVRDVFAVASKEACGRP